MTDQNCDVLVGVSHCRESVCVAGCRNNHHCASLDPSMPLCPFAGGQCVALSSEVILSSEEAACRVSPDYDDATMGDFTAESMLVMGAFAPTLRSSLWLTFELAINELSRLRTDVADELPPVLVALCDDDRTRIGESMRYLTQIGVRAAVASMEDAVLRDAVRLVDPSYGLLFLSPYGAAAAPSSFADRADLVWYLGSRYNEAAVAYDSLLQLAVEAAARRVPVDDLRMVVVVGASTEDRVLEQAVREQISISPSAARLLASGQYRRFELVEDSVVERAAQVAQIVEYAPHVIAFIAGGTFSDSGRAPRASVVHSLESSTDSAWQPLYVFGPRNVDDDSLRRLAVTSESFRSRSAGADWSVPLERTLSSAILQQFKARFPAGVVPETNLSVVFNAYDAVYYLVFALLASNHGTSTDVPQALMRVVRPDAELVTLDAAGFIRGLELIRSGADINASGSRGVAAFQSETHSRIGSAELYCWEGDGELQRRKNGEHIMFMGSGCAAEALP